MKTRLLGGIAALVVAVIGTVILFNYVQGADKRALANTETEDVFVVKQRRGSRNTRRQTWRRCRHKVRTSLPLPQMGSPNLASLGNKVTSVALVPGEQLLNSRLVEANAYLGPARVEVPAGLQEITVRLGIDRVVGGRDRSRRYGRRLHLHGRRSSEGAGCRQQRDATDIPQGPGHGVQFSSGAAAQTQPDATDARAQGHSTLNSQKANFERFVSDHIRQEFSRCREAWFTRQSSARSTFPANPRTPLKTPQASWTRPRLFR